MTLKSCPECSHEVSSLASACPSCGFPLEEDPVIAYTQRRLDFKKKAVKGLIIVAILCALLGFVNSEFFYLAFVMGIAALVGLFGLDVAQAHLDKSKLK